MTRPEPFDLARLRRRPHRTKLYLGIYQPETALACQVDSAGLAQGDYVIPYDNVSEGNLLNVESGMTLYVGTQPGGHDVGRIRIKSAAAATIEVAENNDIVWADDLYLTIVHFFEPWAVYPRIELINEVPIFYKDYDIPYTDQNELFDPVICMGPHHAGFRATGAYDVYYSSSGTFDPTDGASPTGYAWWFQGADITGSFEPHPREIPYSTPGHYTTHLIGTTGYGKSLHAHRHVMIFDRPGEGPDVPIMDWGLLSFEGSRGANGYGIKVFVREEADFDKVVPGALAVIFSDDWYGEERISIGGNAVGRPSILFCGYVEEESIMYNSYTSRLEFRVANVTQLMDIKATFSVSLEDRAIAPDYWYQMRDMTVDKAMIHYLRWHSTILHIADFAQTGDTKAVQYIDFGRGTLLSEATELYDSALGAEFVSDRQGKIWAEINLNLTATGSRTQPEIMELERQDWMGQINFSREFYEGLSYLEAGGIAYSGRTGTMEPLLSGAPGDAPSYHGGVQRLSGLVLTGQDQLNEWTGLAFARANALYPELSMDLSGDYRFIDIAPQEFLPLTLQASDTYRGLVWNKKRFTAKGVAFRYNPQGETLYYMLSLEEESSGPPGVTIEIPVDPPWDSPVVPNPVLPPFPPIPIPPIPPPLPGAGDLVYICTSNKIVRSRNFGTPVVLDTTFDDITPTWADGVTGGFVSFYLDPVDPQNRCYLLTSVWTGSGPAVGSYLYRGEYLNSASPTWTLLANPMVWRNLWGGSSQTQVSDIAVSRVTPSVVWTNGTRVALGAHTHRVGWSPDHGVTWYDRTPAADLRRKQNQNIIIEASEWSAISAFDSGHTGPDDVIYTNLAGTTWFGSAFFEPQDFCILYQGNEGDQALYVSEDTAANKKLMWSPDRAGLGKIDITPYFENYYWACARSGVGGGMFRQIRTAWGNSNVVFAMLQQRRAEPQDSSPTTFFMSMTGPHGLIPRRKFEGRITCLLVHRNNDNLLYALRYQEWGREGQIWYSPNMGLSWFDYTPAWERDIGAMAVTGFSAKRIEPAWTV